MFAFRSTWPILHDLLVFGALVLEPYLHLEVDEGKTVVLQTLGGHVSNQLLLPWGKLVIFFYSLNFTKKYK